MFNFVDCVSWLLPSNQKASFDVVSALSARHYCDVKNKQTSWLPVTRVCRSKKLARGFFLNIIPGRLSIDFKSDFDKDYYTHIFIWLPGLLLAIQDVSIRFWRHKRKYRTHVLKRLLYDVISTSVEKTRSSVSDSEKKTSDSLIITFFIPHFSVYFTMWKCPRNVNVI